jgi:putative ABC transport system permease protein
MQTVRRDVVYALRTWRQRPAAVAAAILALALGIGATTTVFSIVSGLLLKPLPYAEPERLVMVWRDARARGGPAREWVSPGHVVDWQERGAAFDHVAAIRGWAPNLTGGGEPERLRGAAVSSAYFDILGVEAATGRTFAADEDRPGGPPVALLGHGLWERRFGRDPSIVGRSVLLDRVATTVVGVMPPSFRSPVVEAEIWSPIRISKATAQRGMITLRVLARLRAGVTIEQARSTADVLVDPADPDDAGTRPAIVPLHDDMVGPVRPVLLVLAGTVLLVLLIACANVANLLLARASERAREISIRLALGASRRDIVRQLLAESLSLAFVGGTLGLVLGWWGLHAVLAIAPANVPRINEVELDTGTLAFTVVVSVFAAMTSGLAPAVATARAELLPALKDTGREGSSGARLRSALVVVEVTLAMALVAGAGLLVRSLVSLQQTDLGFDPANVVTASIAPPRGTYRDEAAVRQLHAQLLEQARAIPDVEYAAITSVLPLTGANTDITFAINGRTEAAGAAPPAAWFRVVSPDYFPALRMRLLEGRLLAATDSASAPGAVVINETLVRRYWAGTSPLGVQVRVGRLDATIIGIVADSRHRGPTQDPDPEMYLSAAQFPSRAMFLVLRGRDGVTVQAPALRAAVRQVDPLLPAANIVSMPELRDRVLTQPRFIAALLTGFAILAAVLALVGVYGVLSFAVSRRTREIGVRMALGAERRAVIRLVLVHGLALTGIGIMLGLGLAAILSRSMRALLHGVAPGDPATLGSLAVLIALAALAASYAPARRASLVDPVVALRDE